jgi:hypothetical protein
MYRVFCESYKNYLKTFENDEKDEYRRRISEPLSLIVDADRYFNEKRKETLLFKQLSDLLFYMEKVVEQYPCFKAFLWTIESKGVEGSFYGCVPNDDLNEQAKLVQMFLKLMYWDETV